MSTTDPAAELRRVGTPSQVHGPAVSAEADAPGSVFVLDHRRDGEDIQLFFLEGGDTGDHPTPPVVVFPAALLRELHASGPEVPESGPLQARPDGLEDRT